MSNSRFSNKGRFSPARSGAGKPLRLLALLGACALALSGCRYTAAPADLLRPPKEAPQAGGMSSSLKQLLPAGSSLALPARERQPEAIRSIDLDGDGSPEAVLTYSDAYGSSRILIARREAGEWKTWALLRSAMGTSLEWLSFIDMDGDKRPEILAGWRVSQPGNSFIWQQYEVQVYSASKPSFEESEEGRLLRPVAELGYEAGDTGDVDGDGRQELVLVRRPGSPNEPMLEVHRFADGKLARAATLPLQPDATLYERLAIGRIAKDRFGIIAEAGAGAHSSLTLMAGWYGDRLEQVYPPADEPDLGFNMSPVLNTDINGDGILEWSRQVEAPGQPEGTAYADLITYTEWTQWSGLRPQDAGFSRKDMFLPVTLEYNDYSYGVSVQIPSRWRGQFTLSRPGEETDAIIQLDYYNAKSGAIAPLWTLYGIPVKEWGSWSAGMEGQGRKPANLRTAGGFVYAAVEEPKPKAEDGWSATDLNRYDAMRLTGEQLASSVRLQPGD
ncbi:VCBS repeat-containing protein [Paenibacillus albicereus]|uniref:VCBS repeat-containing protein n=1 Tax=Paenibacillus albicereus TaxID=2726185 RepID=A0A6H2H1J5_9BACL|nr:VCBS repeat-containing protein [Paenibacillus albicereus]QJC53561.1 VCBS repeat-containing protein [Paenibacillus albicereus]